MAVNDMAIPFLSPGWNGLMPGESSLSDAINTFGGASQQSSFVNGTTYEFLNGAVQVIILQGQQTIYKIRVLSSLCDSELMPENIDQVMQKYGPLIQIRSDELGNVTYEGPGLRVECSIFDNPQTVKWLEFYQSV